LAAFTRAALRIAQALPVRLVYFGVVQRGVQLADVAHVAVQKAVGEEGAHVVLGGREDHRCSAFGEAD
jgi:hypothetical protein